MGDHRASIKIEMTFHGIKDSVDMWINYFPEECCSMDKRVVEFFKSVYERGMDEYEEKLFEAQREYREQEIERTERETLKRLKDKYEPPLPEGES